MVEAANALFLEERGLPVLDMLNGILEEEMDRKSSRQERALKLPVAQPFTSYGTVKFTESNHFCSAKHRPDAVSCPRRWNGYPARWACFSSQSGVGF